MKNKINKVSILINKKDYNSALSLINKYLEKNKNNIDLLELKANILKKYKKYYEASKIYIQILNLDYKNINALINLFIYYDKNKQYDNALFFILKLKDSNNIKFLFMISKTYYNLELYKDSIYYSNKILNLDSNNIRALVQMSKAYLQIKSLKKAYIFIKKALDLEPSNTYVLIQYSKYLKSINDLDNSINILNKIIDINPNIILSYLELLKIYVIKKDINNIKDIILKFSKLKNNNSYIYKIRIEILKLTNYKSKNELLSFFDDTFKNIEYDNSYSKKNKNLKNICNETQKNINNIDKLSNTTTDIYNLKSIAHVVSHGTDNLISYNYLTESKTKNKIIEPITFENVHKSNKNSKKNIRKKSYFLIDINILLNYFMKNLDKASKQNLPNNRVKYILKYKNCGYMYNNLNQKEFLNNLCLILNKKTDEIFSFYPIE